MRWTLVAAGGLLPVPICGEVLGAAPLPRLRQLLAQAQQESLQPVPPACRGDTRLSWLWGRFGGRGQPPVTAPFVYRELVRSEMTNAGNFWWQIDPVHFALASDHLLLQPLADLDQADAAALAAAAQTVLAPQARIKVHGPHWLLQFAEPWDLHCTPLAGALGGAAQHLLPTGADATHWRRLLTEVQMLWHTHPVNIAREARGAVAVNGLWLHGGGRAQPLRADGLDAVVSADPALRGWARAAGVPQVAEQLELPALRGNALLDWSDGRALLAARRAQAWGDWLPLAERLDAWVGEAAATAFAAGATLQLVLCGEQATRSLRLTARDRLALWRRPSFAALLSEPAEAEA